jgi:hypothetical protein
MDAIPVMALIDGNINIFIFMGLVSQGRKSFYMKEIGVLHSGFCNILVTCSSKKELLVISKCASCLRTDRANNLNPCK